MMDLVVATPAQTHEIIIRVSAAFGDGHDVMHLFCRYHSPFGIATFTVRMS